MTSASYLFKLRLLQLARPLIFIVILRYVDYGLASYYTTLLSAYIISTEIYNVLAPSDRLFLSSALISDAAHIAQRRYLYIFFVAPITTLLLSYTTELSLIESILISTLSALTSISIVLIAYFNSKASGKTLIFAEIISWLTQLSALLVIIKTQNTTAGFILYAAEIFFRSIIYCRPNETKLEARKIFEHFQGLPINFGIINKSLSLFSEGATLTFANQIPRLPFLTSPESIDPIYMIAAQLSAASYNLLISISSKVKIPAPSTMSLAMSFIIATAFIAISEAQTSIFLYIANNILLFVLAALHGWTMIQIPGPHGIGSDKSSRAMLLGLLFFTTLLGIYLSPAVFLFSPAALTVAALFHKRHRHAKL